MNYRHRFHAGNVADVFKHLVLLELLERLRAKDSPFCVIDSHAGSGLYRLEPPRRVRARHRAAVAGTPRVAAAGRVLCRAGAVQPAAPACLSRLAAAHCRAAAAAGPRAVSRATAAGGGAAARQSARNAAGDRTAGRRLGGTQGPVAPAREPRAGSDRSALRAAPGVRAGCGRAQATRPRRWRNGVYALWYPIKARRPVDTLHAQVGSLALEAWAVNCLRCRRMCRSVSTAAAC
ncbi:MAG: hypothetical protein MZV65_52715 [Chromatiales bacterium]|nr:hypothetical protein [Chromatiales bacterium]